MSEFARPLLLPLAVLAPAALAWLAFVRRRHLRVPGLNPVRRPRLWVDFAAALALGGLACAWLGAAGPRRASLRSAPSTGRDLVVLLDLSASMGRPNDARSGLAAAREAVQRLSDLRRDDRLALVAFGDKAAVLSPLTRDHATLLALASNLSSGTFGAETAIGDALAVAIHQLRASRRGSGAIVLVSDGESNSGAIDPLTAADVAADRGVPVSTVAVGPDALAGVPSRVNEKLLREIARRTGGEFARARDEATLTTAFEQLAALEPRTTTTPTHRVWIDLSATSAGWAAVLLTFAAAAELLNRKAWA